MTDAEKLAIKEAELIELRECYDLVLKSARRAARDLRHAADHIEDREHRSFFQDRYLLYDTIFGDTTDYRARLHEKIVTLENILKNRGIIFY